MLTKHDVTAAASPTYAETVARLHQITAEFYETGIAVFTNDCRGQGCWKKRKPLLCPYTLRKYLRAVARDLKRPYVYVEHTLSYRYDPIRAEWTDKTEETWFLTLPRRKYTAPLVSALMLVAESPRTSSRQKNPRLVMWTQRLTWGFLFSGEEGKPLFEHWLAQCREDPDFRKALRLPPTPTTVPLRQRAA